MSIMSDPARAVAAVTPGDSTNLGPVRGLYVGTTGNVVVKTEQTSTAVTFANVPAGTVLPVRANYVMAATTASDIVALY